MRGTIASQVFLLQHKTEKPTPVRDQKLRRLGKQSQLLSKPARE